MRRAHGTPQMIPVIREVGSAERFHLGFHEMAVLLMMAAKRSPKEIRERLGVGGYEPSSDLVLKIVHGIREKLSCGMSETLVECARRQGVIK
jgi:hypothetical protein